MRKHALGVQEQQEVFSRRSLVVFHAYCKQCAHHPGVRQSLVKLVLCVDYIEQIRQPRVFGLERQLDHASDKQLEIADDVNSGL